MTSLLRITFRLCTWRLWLPGSFHHLCRGITTSVLNFHGSFLSASLIFYCITTQTHRNTDWLLPQQYFTALQLMVPHLLNFLSTHTRAKKGVKKIASNDHLLININPEYSFLRNTCILALTEDWSNKQNNRTLSALMEMYSMSYIHLSIHTYRHSYVYTIYTYKW